MTRIEHPDLDRARRAYRRASSRVRVAAPAVHAARPVAPVLPAVLPDHVRAAFVSVHEETEALKRSLALARRRIAELEQLVEADELVPVANRRGFMRDLQATLADVERHGLSAALIFVDVDRLKTINDSFGHVAGDAALVHVGEALKAHVRESDTVARIGGDEFAIILRHVDEAAVAAKAAQAMADIAATPVRSSAAIFPVSASAGYRMLQRGEDAAAVLAAADRAMYHEKAARRA